VSGSAGGRENAFCTTPRYADLNWAGLDFSQARFDTVTSIDRDAWQTELGLHDALFQQLAHHLPVEMTATKLSIEKRLGD
jgi:phosphoenolpyruvate carboxykinase (GTP)